MNDLSREILGLEKTVDSFAVKMKAKLISKAEQGFRGWRDPNFKNFLEGNLAKHVAAQARHGGQCVDIANLAMFLHVQEEEAKRD